MPGLLAVLPYEVSYVIVWKLEHCACPGAGAITPVAKKRRMDRARIAPDRTQDAPDRAREVPDNWIFERCMWYGRFRVRSRK